MNIGDPLTNGHGTTTRRKLVKSIRIIEVDGKTERFSEILKLTTVDQDERKRTLSVPFRKLTPARLAEITPWLLNREFIQGRDIIPLKVAKPVATFEEMYPYDALQALLEGYDQRALKFDRCEQYASELIAENWEPTWEGWAFDNTGKMINGQHQAWATILTGKPMRTLVVRGLNPTAKQKGDSGMVRTNACKLELDPGNIDLTQLPPTALMNAILTVIFKLGAGSGEAQAIWRANKDHLASMIRKYRGALEWLNREGYASTKGVTRDFTKAATLAGFIIAYNHNPKAVERIAHAIFHGSREERYKNPAIKSLFTYLDAGKTAKAAVRLDGTTKTAHRVLQAIRAYIQKDKGSDPVGHGFPKSQEGMTDVLTYFCVKGARRSLIPNGIDVNALARIKTENKARVQQHILEQLHGGVKSN